MSDFPKNKKIGITATPCLGEAVRVTVKDSSRSVLPSLMPYCSFEPQGMHKDYPHITPRHWITHTSPLIMDCPCGTPASLDPHPQFLLNWDIARFQHLSAKAGLQRDGETLRTPGTKARPTGGHSKWTLNARADSAIGFLSSREGVWDGAQDRSQGKHQVRGKVVADVAVHIPGSHWKLCFGGSLIRSF